MYLDVEDYIGRKGIPTINVQAVCDADYRITSLSAVWPGRTHDSRVFRNSNLREQFENGQHQGFLISDSGYGCTSYLMTPFLNPGRPAEERFNSSLCRTRVLIEQTFGILKQRFQILRRKIMCSPLRCCKYITSCAVLHTIGINRNDIIDVQQPLQAFEPRFDAVGVVHPEGRAMRNHIANTYFN